MRTFLIIAVVLSVITFGGFFYLSSVAQYSHGPSGQNQRFEVEQGENIFSLAQRLESDGLIASRYAFIWHIVREGKTKNLVAGTYGLNGALSIADIAFMVTEGKTLPRDIRVTFPEGWDTKKMAERLTANGLPGAAFLILAQQPKSEWRQTFDFLADAPADVSLEGFLFPDTYFFYPQASAEDIIEKMLENFGKKIDTAFRAAAEERQQGIYRVVVLASIVENEVKTEIDRKMVADIFWRRLAIGQPLQSDATVKYILGIDKIQHTFEETRTESPYNTYIHTGLPLGPIGNPGMVSLSATLFPISNPYFYFLSDPKTGKTIFSVTYEEHLNNKNLYGL
ncbi:MAG: endolytic transglycosylase MltG [Patescibacteria group bacterium]